MTDINTVATDLKSVRDKLANKLTECGVTVSSTDGPTTLAKKISFIGTSETEIDSTDIYSGSTDIQQNKITFRNYLASQVTKQGTTVSDTDSILELIDKIENKTPANYYILTDDASTDMTSNYESSVGLRNSGTGTITHNSNGYYVLTNTKANSMSYIPIQVLHGKQKFIIEFDSYFPTSNSNVSTGLVVCQSSTDWCSHYANDMNLYYWGTMLSNVLTRSSVNYTSLIADWTHNKYVIDNGWFSMVLTKQSGESIYSTSQQLDSRFNTTTNDYGFPILWAANSYYIKNIKIY
jgi:hypothetical protein